MQKIKLRLKNFIRTLWSYRHRCEHCKEFGAYYGRASSQYAVEKQNWHTLCPDCWQELNEYYDDLWTTYRSMVF